MIVGIGKIYGTGMSFPPRVGPDGRIVWSQGEENIREAIQVILKTEPGERVRLGDFGAGLGRYLFEPNNAGTHAQLGDRVRTALARWEPRIQVQSVDVVPDRDDREAATATITYKLVASQRTERVSLTVSLGG